MEHFVHNLIQFLGPSIGSLGGFRGILKAKFGDCIMFFTDALRAGPPPHKMASARSLWTTFFQF